MHVCSFDPVVTSCVIMIFVRISEAETRQRLVRTVKKEVGVFT